MERPNSRYRRILVVRSWGTDRRRRRTVAVDELGPTSYYRTESINPPANGTYEPFERRQSEASPPRRFVGRCADDASRSDHRVVWGTDHAHPGTAEWRRSPRVGCGRDARLERQRRRPRHDA
jgi:hypothetical protein